MSNKDVSLPKDVTTINFHDSIAFLIKIMLIKVWNLKIK
jgi:hypothetical protein